MNFVLYKTSIDVKIVYVFINFSKFLQKAMNNYYFRSYETTEVWDHCRNSLWNPIVQKQHLFKFTYMFLNVAFESDRNFGLVLISSNLFVKLLEGIVGKENPCSTSSLFEWIWILSLNKLQNFPFKNHVGNLKLNCFFLNTQQIGHKRLFQTFLKWQEAWTLDCNYWYQFCHLSYNTVLE